MTTTPMVSVTYGHLSTDELGTVIALRSRDARKLVHGIGPRYATRGFRRAAGDDVWPRRSPYRGCGLSVRAIGDGRQQRQRHPDDHDFVGRHDEIGPVLPDAEQRQPAGEFGSTRPFADRDDDSVRACH